MKKPVAKDYLTDDQLHTVMRDYAEYRSAKTVLEVTLEFNDGSVFRDTIPRFEGAISYKTLGGETYTVPYLTTKYVDVVYSDGKPLSLNEMKKAVKEWVMRDGPTPVRIRFKEVGESL